RREQPLDVRALVRLRSVVGAPARLRVRLAANGHRLGHAAVLAHVTPPGDPEQDRVHVLAGVAALLVVGTGAGRLLDVDEVALRGARLRGHSPAAADPLDLSRGGDL